VTRITRDIGYLASARWGRALLAGATALNPRPLEELAVLLLRHPLPALLDNRTHALDLFLTRDTSARTTVVVLSFRHVQTRSVIAPGATDRTAGLNK
jgi:hypothetical protein